ncbi:hypothetical protein FNH05_27170 [Amycolatopsis rhizosphaerae]|uniref:Galactan 5-O-arabinofuranosyltransferase n=1 Tax=Amycolatopsis rhizosphaerae TaxID=2053003 RepID=A0A558BA15_9PSEU|nr:arabinofuranosyltransferase [Amycolatopsis rhizosphaerae]TVT33362.1 hypothetical protein FNH05_27170 [Amycolatopsis rhizosphaerae]
MTSTLVREAAPDAVPGPEEPPVTRLTLGRTLGELLLATVVAVVLGLALQFAASRIGTDPGTNVPDALVNLADAGILLVLCAVIGFGLLRRWPGWVKVTGVSVALTSLATLLLAIPLQGTRFFLGGSSVDNTFRLQYLERMASSSSLADMNYHGLAPYYPGGWFWLGGRFANLLGWDGWAAYKPYATTWAAVAAAVTFVLWSLVVRRRIAVLLSLATVLVGCLSAAVEEPYAWPSTAWLPPVAVLAWTVLRRRGRVPAWPLLLIGVYLGFAAITYTLHLVFGVLVVVLLAAVAGVLAVRRGAPAGQTVARLLRRLVVIGVVTGLLALVTWGPFILAGGLGKPNVAAHFLPDTSAYFPMPFEPTSVFGLLCLAGLLWLLLRSRRDPVAFTLLTIAVVIYVWFALSTLALLVRTTLLAFRFVPTAELVFALAGVFAVAEAVRHLPKPAAYARPVAVAMVVLGFAGSLSLAQTSVRSTLEDGAKIAESDYYATGYNAKGEHDTSKDGAWTAELISTIDRLSGRPPTQNIVLSAYDRLLSFAPYWGFQQTTPHYANPLADYRQRGDEIRHWAASTTPNELIARLAANPHEAPNVFVLRRSGDKLVMPVASDSFPQAAPVHVDDIAFDPKLFASPRFTQQGVGPFVVIVTRR